VTQQCHDRFRERWLVRLYRAAASCALALCVFLCGGLGSARALAGEIPRMYRSGYHLGMGDTGVSFARGADAVFYNPAGIAQDDAIVAEISVLSPQIEFDRNSQNLVNMIRAGSDQLSLVSDAVGKQQYAALQNYTGFVFSRAAAGIFQRAQADAFIGTDPLSGLPRAEVGSTIYAGAHLAYARAVVDGLLLGLNLKVVQKAETRESVSVLEAQQIADGNVDEYLNKAVRRGTGLGADLGLIYKGGKQTPFSFGAVAKNLGLDYHWPVEPGLPAPSAEASVVDLGLSIEPQTRKSRSRISIDYRDVFDEQGENAYKRLHIGAEVSFQDVLGGAVGLNQGYLTYSGIVRLWLVRAELGVFSEELGAYPGNRQSKRAFGRLSLGWFP
jgi:hypothetical protein